MARRTGGDAAGICLDGAMGCSRAVKDGYTTVPPPLMPEAAGGLPSRQPFLAAGIGQQAGQLGQHEC